MLRWFGKTVVITGAAEGIGKKLTEDLSSFGMKVIALDYTNDQINKIEENIKAVNGSCKGEIIPMECDIRNIDQVKEAFKIAEDRYGGVDVLINNAAILTEGLFDESDINRMKSIIDTNLLGVISCTKEAMNSMKKKTDQCYILMMNSISGHYLPAFSKPILNIYPYTKYGMTIFTEQLRREMRHLKLNIKVTNLCPGLVDTTIFPRDEKSVFSENKKYLNVEDISDTVKYLLSTPPSVHIQDILIRALHEQL